MLLQLLLVIGHIFEMSTIQNRRHLIITDMLPDHRVRSNAVETASIVSRRAAAIIEYFIRTL